MSDKKSFYIATLALIVALGVAIYVQSSLSTLSNNLQKIISQANTLIEKASAKEVGGISNLDELVLSGALTTASSTVQNQMTLASSTEKYVGNTFAAGAQFGFWYNDTGRIAYADMGMFGWETGTASSSFRIAMFATTTNPNSFVTSQAFTAQNGTAGLNLVGATTFATSSTATTTNSYTTNGTGIVPIANGAYLVTYLQRGDASCINLPTLNGCEAATSTNRGFNPFWRAHITW